MTNSFANIQCYDAIKVDAILNEIGGKNHTARFLTHPVPNLRMISACQAGPELIERMRAAAVIRMHRQPQRSAAPMSSSDASWPKW